MRLTVLLSLLMLSTTLVYGGSVGALSGDEASGVKWKNSTVKIAVSTTIDDSAPNIKNGSRIREALFRSILRWEAVADVRFITEYVERETTSTKGNSGDGISLITMSSLPEFVQLFGKSGSREAARTRVYFDKRGNIYEADLFLNPFALFSTDGSYGTFDLESVFTHELGHVLGLRHNHIPSSMMFDAVSENGPLGPLAPPRRDLLSADIAAVRSLYGTISEDGECCAAVSGRLLFTGKGTKAGVFVEEFETGRLIAVTESSTDGKFDIAGLSDGIYNLFWLRDGTFGYIDGYVDLTRTNGTIIETQRVRSFEPIYVPTFIGIYGILSESAVSLRKGEQYRVFFGGQDAAVESMTPLVRGPFITIDASTKQVENYGRGLFVTSFILKVDADAPSGAYSVMFISEDGRTGISLGAIDIR